VERICDAVAIVDRGQVVMQGTIDELKAAGARGGVLVGVDDPERAAVLLRSHPAVDTVARLDDALQVGIADGLDPRAAHAEIAAALVGAGLRLHRLEPVEVTLEQRFLEITSRLGEAA
jgi:ABC-2 type transport system ATP-binding protein